MILGVDPGKGGGLAWVGADGPLPLPMPAEDVDLWDAIRSTPATSHAFLEFVRAMPGQGVTSMFTFGGEYRRCRMALVAAGIPFEEVRPQTWQASFGLKKRKGETPTAWKNRLKAKAQELFPKIKVTLKTADALLIAEYGRREIAKRNGGAAC